MHGYVKTILIGLIVVFFCTAVSAAEIDPIIGGDDVLPGTYPWMAGIVNGSAASYAGQYCGGVLIAPEWVLTAAHCVDFSPGMAPSIDVVLGTVNLTAPVGSYERIPVGKIVIHPDYNSFTGNNDIALLQLETPSTNEPISHIISADEETVYLNPGIMATTMGWGDTNPNEYIEDYPVVLQQVQVPIVSDGQCVNVYGYYHNYLFIDTMFCAGYEEGGKDACYGDSGGPLVVRDNRGEYRLVGLVLGGYGCGFRNYFGIYTRVSAFKNWIDTLVFPVEPVITTNGQTGSLNLSVDEIASISVSLNGSRLEGRVLDWWLSAEAPFGEFWFNPSLTWSLSEDPICIGQMPFMIIDHYPIFQGNLPEGDYRIFFAVDETPNGIIDGIIHKATVKIHVGPHREVP